MAIKGKVALGKWMKIRGLRNQAELAAVLGISEAYISYYFLGKRTFGAKTALRISKKTGIPMEDLYR